jgi:stearoyl-CoA desaturase (delta-9 desaturase)
MNDVSSPARPGASRHNQAHQLERRVAWLVILVPLAGFLLAVVSLWGYGVRPLDLGLCLGLGVVTQVGITAGYHRLFTHQSFAAHPVVRWALGIAGSMAAQGPLLFWVACHRRHHQCSDTAEDPHTPRPGGSSAWGQLRGLWHAHIGWMLCHEPEPWGRYVPDLLRDEVAFRLNNTYLVWLVCGLALPAVIGGLAGGWFGALTGLLWGGLARIFLIHHVTWSINSVCHAVGSQPYDTGDDSRNNVVCGLLALGEGWHNNHHAFPTSAQHGLAWWQLDATYLLIRLLALVGLAWDIKLPRPSHATDDPMFNDRSPHEYPRTERAERLPTGHRSAL